MVRFEGDLQPTAVTFTHAAFWIRIHNLPIKSMIQEVGEDRYGIREVARGGCT